MGCYRVRNWRRFQHYRDRKPRWIKLYRDILDDFEYLRMPLASMALAPCFLLLASESEDGTFSDDPERLAFRLHQPVEVVVAALQGCEDADLIKHEGEFASSMLAARKQHAIPERERETEKKTLVPPDAAPLVLVPDEPRKPAPPKKQTDPNVAKLIAHYSAEFQRIFKAKPTIHGGKDGQAAKALLSGRTFEEAASIVTQFILCPPTWNDQNNAYDLAHIAQKANTILARRTHE